MPFDPMDIYFEKEASTQLILFAVNKCLTTAQFERSVFSRFELSMGNAQAGVSVLFILR